MCGSTGSGKTCWVKKHCQLNGHRYDRIYAVAGSARYNSDYDFLPRSRILDPDVDMRRLYKIVALQRKIREKKKKYNILLIFDDIVGLLNTHQANRPSGLIG